MDVDSHDCDGCRFWSEMIAQLNNETGMVEALCLAPSGPHTNRYTTERVTCAAWKSGHLGAVDEPPDYGAATRALYDAEDRA